MTTFTLPRPGEAVQIRLRTVGQLPVVRGEWTLRLPLVVAPRYTSGFPLPKCSVGDGVTLDTDQVPDASAVTPPTWLPGFASPVDLQISVDIDLGRLVSNPDWSQQIRSSLHAVRLESHSSSRQPTDGACRVSVYPGERVNRDFILRGDISDTSVSTALVIEPASQTSSQPTPRSAASSQTESPDPLGTFALHIAPPRCDAQVPRDIVFLLDRSGSMSGWKMDAARRGISRLIDTLRDDEDFELAVDDDVCLGPPPVPDNRPGIVHRSKIEQQSANPSPSEAPVVGLVHLMMAEAVQLRASQLILRPGEDAVTVILVIDGDEVERERIPRRMLAAIITRLKILANVDISVRDQPQSGKIDITVGDRRASCVVHFAAFEEGATVLMDFTARSPHPHSRQH